MHIIRYESVQAANPAKEVEWTGNLSESQWSDLALYSVIRVDMHENRVAEALSAYRQFISASTDRVFSDLLEAELGRPCVPSRFTILSLLLRIWAVRLHGDQLTVVTSSDVAPANRIRSYKGILDHAYRVSGKFEQLEKPVGNETFIIEALTATSLDLPNGVVGRLSDMFLSFGGFDMNTSSESILSRAASAYGNSRKGWRLQPDHLLPAICQNDASVFFFRGTASIDNLSMILYTPRIFLDKHVEIACAALGAFI